VPAQTTYIGCDNGCTFSSPLVVWPDIALAPGYSATRCFWVRVTSYPFIIREGEFFADFNFRAIAASQRNHKQHAGGEFGRLFAVLNRNILNFQDGE
jgi:hypothetical protein